MKKIALVTGASRGIGRGIALALAGEGWDVAINYNSNAEAAAEVQNGVTELGQKAVIIKADIADPDDRARLVDTAVDGLGKISLLVNNAGIAPKERADILSASEASFDELISTNLKGPYFLTQIVANRMIAAMENGSELSANIVFITSISAYTASVNRGDYCISKAGLSMASKLFAARLAEHKIGVFEVQPGIIETDMTGGVKEKYDKLILEDGLLPTKRWGTPEDIGRVVVAIARGSFAYSTGAVIPVDGGFQMRTL